MQFRSFPLRSRRSTGVARWEAVRSPMVAMVLNSGWLVISPLSDRYAEWRDWLDLPRDRGSNSCCINWGRAIFSPYN